MTFAPVSDPEGAAAPSKWAASRGWPESAASQPKAPSI